MRRLVCVIFLIALTQVSAAEFTFDNKPLKVPDGYEVELIAGPPMVKRPISIALDELGRMYVTESSGNSGNAAAQMKDPQHQIFRLEDTDGDGRYDKKTVYADKVMFPEGCMYLDGSVYVTAVPQILKFTDIDGDGVSDKREVWHDGKTATGCANDLHGPYLGNDGWIYWCKGAWGQQTIEREGKPPLTTRAAHIFRARPDGSGKEWVMAGGMDNPVGVAFTASGERILSCTFYEPTAGKRDGLIHAIYGGVYGKPHDPINDHKMTGDLMPGLTHSGASAPCGIICYRSNLLGEFSGNLFACYFNLHKVMRHELVPDGATFTTRDSDIISSTNVDFHPTDVLEDADGSLIVVDTGGWYKVCCPTSQIAKPDIFGAIYRIRKTGAPKVEDPRGLKIDWAKQNTNDLSSRLGDGRVFVQQRAISELQKRGAGAVQGLAQSMAVEKKIDLLARERAVWALTRMEGDAARSGIRNALKKGSVAAIHSAGLWRDLPAVELLLNRLESEDAQIVRAAAEALGRIGDKRAVPALLAAVGKLKVTEVSAAGAPVSNAQRILEHSLIYALIEIGDAAETATGLSSPNVMTRRAALVALDQMDGSKLAPEQIVSLFGSQDDVLKNTAAWVAGHHPEWGPALAAHYHERLVNPPADQAERQALQMQLAKLAKSPAIQELLTAALGDNPNASSLVLGAMTQAGLKQTPDAWLDTLAKRLLQVDLKNLPEFLSAAASLPQPKGGHAALASTLLELARKTDLPPAQRIKALQAAGALKNIEAPLFDLLLEHTNVAKDPALRAAAAMTLGKTALSPEQQSALAGALKFVGPLELPHLLPALSKGGDEASGLKIVATLRNSPALSAIRPEILKALFEKYPKTVQDAGAELIASLAADSAAQASHLKDLATKLPGGDAERGKALFAGKATCITCHTMGKVGVNFGPDLTTVAQVRSERDLLESIVYPSATFVRSFEPFVVTTNSGELINGILKNETPDEVVLGTAPQVEKRIPRNEIKRMRPDTVSLMPQGFDKLLTPEEIADLIAFLRKK